MDRAEDNAHQSEAKEADGNEGSLQVRDRTCGVWKDRRRNKYSESLRRKRARARLRPVLYGNMTTMPMISSLACSKVDADDATTPYPVHGLDTLSEDGQISKDDRTLVIRISIPSSSAQCSPKDVPCSGKRLASSGIAEPIKKGFDASQIREKMEICQELDVIAAEIFHQPHYPTPESQNTLIDECPRTSTEPALQTSKTNPNEILSGEEMLQQVLAPWHGYPGEIGNADHLNDQDSRLGRWFECRICGEDWAEITNYNRWHARFQRHQQCRLWFARTTAHLIL